MKKTPYIFDPHFVNMGRDIGLLPKDEKFCVALFKNKLHSLLHKETIYNDMFIWGYRDGLEMSAKRMDEVIMMLIANLPVYPTAMKNGLAQIAGFKRAYKVICEKENAGKFCRDCKHYVGINSLNAPYRHNQFYNGDVKVCKAQIHLVELQTNLVTGLQEPVDDSRLSCDKQRGRIVTLTLKDERSSMCGAEGKYWEPKQTELAT